ncbi:MAG: hypothetical protein JWP89_7083 [Schlesneria sp.]|nr:hypothetical protein [Schlesneria sp.]
MKAKWRSTVGRSHRGTDLLFHLGGGFVAWVIISLVRPIEDRPLGPIDDGRLQIELMRRLTTPKMAVLKNPKALPVASGSWKAFQSFQ